MCLANTQSYAQMILIHSFFPLNSLQPVKKLVWIMVSNQLLDLRHTIPQLKPCFYQSSFILTMEHRVAFFLILSGIFTPLFANVTCDHPIREAVASLIGIDARDFDTRSGRPITLFILNIVRLQVSFLKTSLWPFSSKTKWDFLSQRRPVWLVEICEYSESN